jgi:ABC-2 family transporter protein
LFSAFFAITFNSVREIIRQPVYVILLAVGLVLIAISPYVTMFSMGDDTTLMVDMGLATILLLGLILALVCSSQIISREIETRTAGTMMSKPVGRFAFITSKFVAVLCALSLACFMLIVMLLATVRFGVPSAAYMETDVPALLAQILPLVLAVVLGTACNFFFAWNFSSTAVVAALVLFGLSLVGITVIAPDGGISPWAVLQIVSERHMIEVIKAALLVTMGIWVLGALAVTVATRANVVMQTVVCVAVFFLLMIGQFLLSPVVGLDCEVVLGEPASTGPLGSLPNEHLALLERLKVMRKADDDDQWLFSRHVQSVRLERRTIEWKRWIRLDEDGEVLFDKDNKPVNGSVSDAWMGKAKLMPESADRSVLVMRLSPHSELRNLQLVERILDYVKLKPGRGSDGNDGDYKRQDISVWPRYPVGAALVPHLYVFWVGDQLMSDYPFIPFSYVGLGALYALGYCLALLFAAAWLFEGREIV